MQGEERKCDICTADRAGYRSRAVRDARDGHAGRKARGRRRAPSEPSTRNSSCALAWFMTMFRCFRSARPPAGLQVSHCYLSTIHRTDINLLVLLAELLKDARAGKAWETWLPLGLRTGCGRLTQVLGDGRHGKVRIGRAFVLLVGLHRVGKMRSRGEVEC